MSAISQMIDQMLDAGKPDDEIFAAIADHFAPYDKFEEFKQGFADYQQGIDRSRHYADVGSQAYDRGSCTAMWMWVVHNRREYPLVKV